MSWRADEAERESRGQQREASNLRGQEQSRERHDDQAEAGPDARVVSRNALGERALASPAIAHDRIYIRTDQHLFAIGPD